MFAVTVLLTIADQARDDFMPLMHANAQASLAEEPGCHRFDVCWDPQHPQNIFLYELYDDAPAFDAHLRSSHYRRFDAAVSAMVTSKVVTTYSEVRP